MSDRIKQINALVRELTSIKKQERALMARRNAIGKKLLALTRSGTENGKPESAKAENRQPND